MIPFLLAMDADVLAASTTSKSNQASSLLAQATPTDKEPSSVKEIQSRESFPYASLQLGVGFPEDLSGNLNLAPGVSTNTNFNLDTGFNGELAVGYQHKQARAELAVGYSNFNADSLSFGGAPAGSSGSVELTTVMVNGYYDFPIYNKDNSRSRWSPYIGAGIGYAYLNTPSCSNPGCFSGGSTDGFAYQGKVGISYRFAERSFGFVEGGYLGTTTGNVDGVNFDNFGTWRVNVGFRIGFGGAAKAKPAAKVQEQQPEPQVVTPAPSPTSEPAMPIRGLW